MAVLTMIRRIQAISEVPGWYFWMLLRILMKPSCKISMASSWLLEYRRQTPINTLKFSSYSFFWAHRSRAIHASMKSFSRFSRLIDRLIRLISGKRMNGAKGARDQRIKGSREQRIKGARDQGIKGS